MTKPTFRIVNHCTHPRGRTILDENGVEVYSHLAHEVERYLAHLRAEHANGRVAQSTCARGVACDRDRISDIYHWAEFGNRELVLCDEHQQELDRIKKGWGG